MEKPEKSFKGREIMSYGNPQDIWVYILQGLAFPVAILWYGEATSLAAMQDMAW